MTEPLPDRPFDGPSQASPPSSSLFARFGGRAAVERLVDAFYRRVEADPELRPIFPADLASGREKQKLFLEQWMGGESRYQQRYGQPRLRRRHFPFVISDAAVERWLGHMADALRECEIAEDVAAEVLAGLTPLARQMANEGEDVPREPLDDPVLR